MKRETELFSTALTDGDRRETTTPTNQRTLDTLTSEAIRSGFRYEVIGRHLIELAERPQGIELAVAYAAVIAKAKKARAQAQSRNT